MQRLLLSIIISLVLTSCANQPSCNKAPLISWADPVTISTDLNTLTSVAMSGRKTGSEGAALSRSFLLQRFEQIGLSPWQGRYQHPFSYRRSFSNKVGINLIGAIASNNGSKQWRIIIAHYDHLGGNANRYHPGADDNASGVAGLLQLAQQAKNQGSAVNLLFVATDAEEPGLYGGYALVDSLKRASSSPQIEQIELAINLDMIGRPDRHSAIYIEGTRRFESFSKMHSSITQYNQMCIRTRQPRAFDGSVITTNFLKASDHYPLHKAGIPWLYFGVPRHRDYHQTSDTADKINIQFVAAVSESAYQLLKIEASLLTSRH
ncbi:M28 family peptidase [Shewanella sp. 125m-7]